MDLTRWVTDDRGMRRIPLPSRPAHLVLAVSLAGALALGGCGSGSETPAGTTTAPTGTSSGTGEASTTQAPPTTETPVETPSAGRPTPVTMTGTVEDGVESGCQVFTDEATGETYSLAAPLPDTGTGVRDASRITVTGTVDPDMMSFCMQGPILVVTEATPAPPTS